jgi:sulfoxide reductase heme-binding subunit YedZ
MTPFPWLDRSGRFSPLKAATLIVLCAPGVVNAVEYELGLLGARPLTEFIHAMGLWTIRWLLVCLAVTPLRQALRLPRLIDVRRMIGVAAFAYGAIHLTAYAADEAFNLATVASEIALRFYLTIGFAALLVLAALAATSTDGMQRRLGARRWQRLHRAVYIAAALGAVHYFIQSKLEVWEPTIALGLLAWLMGYRLVARRWGTRRAVAFPSLAALALAATLLTAFGEALYFRLAFGVDPLRVLGADLMWSTGVRPAWVVLVFTTVIAAGGALRAFLDRRSRRRVAIAAAG